MNSIRHYLDITDLSADETREVLRRAAALKRRPLQPTLLAGRSLGMIFEKSSTRTRVSFEVGMTQLGGHALFLSPRDTQLGRGEPIPDTARVISRMVDAVMIRNDSQADQHTFAVHSQVPVINGLSDCAHPCQILADLLTFEEQRGSIAGRKVAWIGDANNVCLSWARAASLLGFELHIASPRGYGLADNWDNAPNVVASDDPASAAQGAALVLTDVWASMGQEAEFAQRAQAFADYQVTAALMAQAASDALFMHCLPAHRGEEVAAEVIDGPQSVVWDEAENRLHAQKGLLTYLLDVPVAD
ncbi:MAG: ornithine carbamoyltransferase [Oceanococcaceae bacterium]